MLQVGNYNSLVISRITSSGAVFKSEVGDVLLPLRLVPHGAEPGTVLNVFVYVDSEERLTATTKRPRAVVGDCAVLKVKETTTVGSFLDWGLEKDLLLPFGEQTEPVRRGDQVLVKIYLHDSGRIAATTKLDKFIVPCHGNLRAGEEVDLVVYGVTELGAKVLINSCYGGLVFNSELIVKPACGEMLRGTVKKIREDGKVDISLRKRWVHEADHDRQVILDALTKHNGFLPISDKSSPETIASMLRLSKKSFKKAVGGLYKDGIITIDPTGVTLKTTSQL